MIQYSAGTNQPAIAEAFLEIMRTEGGYKKPYVDLFTVTVAAGERTQQPFKALSLMHRMEKYGYLFCNVLALTAFRKAVKLANAVGQNFVDVMARDDHEECRNRNKDDRQSSGCRGRLGKLLTRYTFLHDTSTTLKIRVLYVPSLDDMTPQEQSEEYNYIGRRDQSLMRALIAPSNVIVFFTLFLRSHVI
jgi:hypothetical protein